MSPAAAETPSAPTRPSAPPWRAVAGAGAVEAAWEQLRWRDDEIPARALTLNLVCRAQDDHDAERLAGWAWALGPRHPARVFIIRPSDEAARLRVAADPDGSELVELACLPERAASLAAPLLVGDLPTLLLWHCERPAKGSKFEGWSELADRILVDAHRMHLNARELAELGTGLRAGCTLSDLTWTRLTPWRQLLCQGLESEAGAFRRIASVSIMAGHGRSLPAGETWRPEASLAAILLAGWMSRQLGWRWESVQSACALAGIRAGGKGIEIEFAPCPPQERHGLLRGMHLRSDDGLEIQLEHRGQRLAVTVEREGQALGEWISPAGEGIRSERDALCEEFSLYGHDEQFQLALQQGLEILNHLEGPGL